MNRRWMFPLGIVFAIAVPSGKHGAAHDIFSAASDSILNSMSDAVAVTPYAEESKRGVIYSLYLWPPRTVLRVCFMDGSRPTRDAAVAAMKKWRVPELSEGRLSFDFGTRQVGNECAGKNFEIRVTFEGDLRWSYIGVASLHSSLRGKPSMFLGQLDGLPWTTESDQVVMHETGHALGLHHEHQHPDFDCADAWDKDWIREHTSWKTAQMVDEQLRPLKQRYMRNQRAFAFLTYDRRSIMHYSFPAGAYKPAYRDRCMTPVNLVPSSQDFRAIRTAYRPRSPYQDGRTRGAWAALVSKPEYRILGLMLP